MPSKGKKKNPGSRKRGAACTITTRTLVTAPDRTADTRRRVGVNERVEMTCTANATWAATSGTLNRRAGVSVIWTAPAVAGTSTITATLANGRTCQVTMTTVEPSNRALTVNSNRAYTAGRAGSGFVANVVIQPTNVSFSRIQVREGAVNSTATGYYDTSLGWNGIAHPVGAWLAVNASNSGLIDTVGTNPPGTAGPFSAGSFDWPIPQDYRVGAGAARNYSTGTHRQQMVAGASGRETTSKEGASRSRTP